MSLDTMEDKMLDVYERADEADEALQEFWPELEQAIREDILARLRDAMEKVEFIRKIATDALGGPDRLVRLQSERDTDDPLIENKSGG